MDEKLREQAEKVFQTLCGVLDQKGHPYDVDREQLHIEFSGQGEDLPMAFFIRVDAEREIVTVYSNLPFIIQPEKLGEVALAIAFINDGLVDGCFDLDVTSGRITFRESNTFCESLMSAEVFDFMLGSSVYLVEQYNDKLLMISKGAMSVADLMRFV